MTRLNKHRGRRAREGRGERALPAATSPITGRAFRARGFTLIEVLVGILILAIALLGLGAIVPVVVRAQRQATDATHGTVAVRAAESYLRGSRELNRLGANLNNGRAGFGVWLLDPAWSPTPAVNQANAYLWDPPAAIELNATTGRMLLEYAPTDPPSPTMIHVADRLYPARDSGQVAPQYVWDIVCRRMATPAGEPWRLQAAVFVRRLDMNIRLPIGQVPGSNPPRSWSVYDVVTGHPSLPAGAAKVPVAVDSQGYPTNTGAGDYAGVRLASASFSSADPDRLKLDLFNGLGYASRPADLVLARQPGQRLVDNLGNVYMVLGTYEGDLSGNTVLIDPPVPGGVPDPSQGAPVERQLRQVAFTPQIPAAVSVIEFRPLDPK
jgi:prepilin-type N-terminal cleavage/methylation domain-containing protein